MGFFCVILYRTRGDGNCLYRACSKLLCGKQDLCDLLRDLTSIELFCHEEFYAFHPYVKEKTCFFKTENSAFSACASDSALGHGYDRKDPSSRTMVVKREAIRNANPGNFSSLLCMFALSSVTGMTITSVYPEKLGAETKYSQYLNGTISPRLADKRFTEKLVQPIKLLLLWTTDGVHTLPGLNTDFQPNHFVPLVEFMSKDDSNKKAAQPQQRKITDLFSRPTHSKKINEIASEGIV